MVQCQVDGAVATLHLSLSQQFKIKQNVELNVATLTPGTRVHVNVKKVRPPQCLPSWTLTDVVVVVVAAAAAAAAAGVAAGPSSLVRQPDRLRPQGPPGRLERLADGLLEPVQAADGRRPLRRAARQRRVPQPQVDADRAPNAGDSLAASRLCR